jgi:hypothetical protein
MKEVVAYFGILGQQVDQKWTHFGRNPENLSSIAYDVLVETPAPSSLCPEVILELLSRDSSLPKQRKSTDLFGQPPVTMYRSDDIEIQAITWMEGTTSTHQHGFDGAFRVAHGSSLHAQYGFNLDRQLADSHLVTGDLSLRSSEILRTGDVRPIVSGPQFIHALFHLERPSMTVVIRNNTSNLPFPQYDYRLPGLGFDVMHRDDALQMRLRGLHALYRINPDKATETVLDAVKGQDLWSAFRICDEWAFAYGGGPVLDDLISRLAKREPILEGILPPMYAEELRRARLLARRGMLRESRHRFFLALIVNLPDRRSIEKSIGEYFPEEEPAPFMVDLIEELASPELRGISGLDLKREEIDAMRSSVSGESLSETLGAVAHQWHPPKLLEHLFSQS